MAASVLERSLQDWQAGLNKKGTFEGTCYELARSEHALTAPACRPLLARARTLLRSRFTGRPFWVAGRELFHSALAQAGSDAPFQRQLQEHIAECDQFLGDAADPSDAAALAGESSSGGSTTAALFANIPAPPQRAGGYLFEGQMTDQGEQRTAPLRPHLLLFDLLGSNLAQQLAAAVAQAQQEAEQQHGSGSSAGGGPEGSGEQDSQQQGSGGQQQQQAAHDPQEQAAQLPPDVLEAIEHELDAIAVQLMEETGQQAQRAAPPASKKVVASLPKEQLSTERLEELGGADLRCPICMDEFAVGDEVQALPCRHFVHPPCLAPWLADKNSCPTCRHELPTDDWQYEDRKEQAKVEEEERRGVDNAVTYNEFLYI